MIVKQRHAHSRSKISNTDVNIRSDFLVSRRSRTVEKFGDRFRLNPRYSRRPPDLHDARGTVRVDGGYSRQVLMAGLRLIFEVHLAAHAVHGPSDMISPAAGDNPGRKGIISLMVCGRVSCRRGIGLAIRKLLYFNKLVYARCQIPDPS